MPLHFIIRSQTHKSKDKSHLRGPPLLCQGQAGQPGAVRLVGEGQESPGWPGVPEGALGNQTVGSSGPQLLPDWG